MRLGLLTAPFPQTPLADVVDWTVANSFESIEIACWPRSSDPTRRYAGTSHIDVADLSGGQARDLRAEIESTGLHISALGYYPNPLDPDAVHRERVRRGPRPEEHRGELPDAVQLRRVARRT